MYIQPGLDLVYAIKNTDLAVTSQQFLNTHYSEIEQPRHIPYERYHNVAESTRVQQQQVRTPADCGGNPPIQNIGGRPQLTQNVNEQQDVFNPNLVFRQLHAPIPVIPVQGNPFVHDGATIPALSRVVPRIEKTEKIVAQTQMTKLAKSKQKLVEQVGTADAEVLIDYLLRQRLAELKEGADLAPAVPNQGFISGMGIAVDAELDTPPRRIPDTGNIASTRVQRALQHFCDVMEDDRREKTDPEVREKKRCEKQKKRSDQKLSLAVVNRNTSKIVCNLPGEQEAENDPVLVFKHEERPHEVIPLFHLPIRVWAEKIIYSLRSRGYADFSGQAITAKFVPIIMRYTPSSIWESLPHSQYMTLEFLLKFLLNYERRVDPYSWLSTSRSIVVKPSLTFLNILNEMGQTMTIEERDRNAGIAFAMLPSTSGRFSASINNSRCIIS
jgi:hypothetical protein